jgi:pectin methylesterase-like acyl-CoA thioesterase
MLPFFHKTASFKTMCIGYFLFTLSFTGTAQNYDFVVAQDGSGNFKTVQAAIDSAPINRTTAFRIFIKNGKYKEKISISSSKPFIHLIGESVANVILTYDDFSGKLKPDGTPHGTSSSASVTVNANDFLAANITFENTTGDAPQALAINLNGDRCVVVNCRFLGGQDTVLANGNAGNRQYFKNCYIDGTVDFIFGSAKAVFDSCIVYGKDRVDATANSYITAANTQTGIPWGYVFRNCTLPSNRGVTKYFLGRPWQNDGTTTPISNTKTSFLNSKMGQTINTAGWSTWNANTNTALIVYAEYKTKKLDGSALDVSQRVAWSKQLTDNEANTYILDTIFNNWKPSDLSPLVNQAWTAPIAVTNFKAVKGTSTTPTNFTWNSSWAINGVKYELLRSTDNKATFTKIYEATASNDTAIVYGTTDTIPSPNKSFFYIVRGTKTGLATHISDTIEISSIPTVAITGTSLTDFLQGLGTPSAAKIYSLSGVNLASDVKITPPDNYEISLNGTTWSKTPLSITPIKNEVAKLNVFVRLNATAVGTFTGDILNEATNAQTIRVSVTGKAQADPLPISNILSFYSFAVNNQDSTVLRDKGIISDVPTLRNMSVSNGISNGGATLLVPYSAITGQAISSGTTGDGLWSTASGGPGGTLNRNFYEQFNITAATNYRVRLDSFILNSSYYLTASNTRLAFVYSKSAFASDSADVTGGIGADGLPMAAAANGGFATPIIAGQDNASTVTNYRLALNGATGVTLQAGQTLTIRVYFSCGSTSAGRYAKLKDVHFKGFSVNTTSLKEATPSVFSLQTNPVESFLAINHKNIDSEPTFTVYNMNGAVQFIKKAAISDATYIHISSLVKGMYLLECVSKQEKVVLKFVKE